MNDGLSLLISKNLINLHFNGDTQCFPLYFYEENKSVQVTLFSLLNITDTMSKALKEEKEYLNYRVEDVFPKKGQKDIIIYNSQITIENIPTKAYEYVVNGKSAIEWIMERYQITTHKDSGITNNPNDWSRGIFWIFCSASLM